MALAFFQLFVQSGHFYLIVRRKVLQLTSLFGGGGGGGAGGDVLNRENFIDLEVFMTMEAIFREVIFFCRNKWMDL